MKKILISALLLLTPLFFISCTTAKPKVQNNKAIIAQAFEQGELAMSNMEYDKALASFKLAIEKGDQDEKTKALCSIIERYNSAKKLFEEGKIKESESELSLIDLAYKNYAIKKDIDELQEKVKDKKTETTSSNKEEKPKENKPTNKEDKPTNKDNNLVGSKKKYLSDLSYLEELEERYTDTSGVTSEMVESIGKCITLWDDKLNEIYKFLKVNMPEKEFAALKKKQIDWIPYRDKKAESDANAGGGGSMTTILYNDSILQSTKNRCYELVNNYMK